jgi:hypothetical protein
MKRKWITLVALFGVLVATATAALAQRLVTPLESNLETLTEDFNAREGQPRLVVILSPT